MKFYPIKTEDYTISLYNFDVEDVYHSKVGAYTEALKKYVIPSGIINFARDYQVVRILDVCYGLGYNSKAAVSEILKVNPTADIHVTVLENDKDVIAFSSIIGMECYGNEVNSAFFNEINTQIDIQQITGQFIKNSLKLQPEIRKKIPELYDLVRTEDFRAKLHNIYYTYFGYPSYFHVISGSEHIDALSR